MLDTKFLFPKQFLMIDKARLWGVVNNIIQSANKLDLSNKYKHSCKYVLGNGCINALVTLRKHSKLMEMLANKIGGDMPAKGFYESFRR